MNDNELFQAIHDVQTEVAVLVRNHLSGERAWTTGVRCSEVFAAWDRTVFVLRSARDRLTAQGQELAEAEKSLVEERRRARELFESAPNACLMTDRHGTIRKANPAAARLLGFEPRMLPGKSLALFVPDVERAEFWAMLNLLGMGLETCHWEGRLQPLIGEARTVFASLSTLSDREGWMLGLRWWLLDITDREKAREQARRHSEAPVPAVTDRRARLELDF